MGLLSIRLSGPRLDLLYSFVLYTLLPPKAAHEKAILHVHWFLTSFERSGVSTKVSFTGALMALAQNNEQRTTTMDPTPMVRTILIVFCDSLLFSSPILSMRLLIRCFFLFVEYAKRGDTRTAMPGSECGTRTNCVKVRTLFISATNGMFAAVVEAVGSGAALEVGRCWKWGGVDACQCPNGRAPGCMQDSPRLSGCISSLWYCPCAVQHNPVMKFAGFYEMHFWLFKSKCLIAMRCWPHHMRSEL